MAGAASALIDVGALKHNLHRVRETAPDAKVMAIVKANGYGHGLLRVATALSEADAYGVAGLAEALALRRAGFRHPVLLLKGVGEFSELAIAAQHDLDIVVHHQSHLELLGRSLLARPVRVWLKIDTGMHRLGIRPEHAADCLQQLESCQSVAGPVHLMTHLACADDRQSKVTEEQLALFNAATGSGNNAHSIANSAGILGWPATHAEWVRPGIMLYGVSPFLEGCGADLELRPVMILRSSLIAINTFRKGESIGYGGSWQCPEDMSIGVAAIGYGDGYPRHARPGTPVLLEGRRVPLVGRVSMDMICLDLREAADARIGNEVELWGPNLPVEEVARHADTIPYELLCGVTQRVRIVERS